MLQGKLCGGSAKWGSVRGAKGIAVGIEALVTGCCLEVDERHVQKYLGHASAEMTRRYQRRHDRFRINLTKAAGL